MTNPGDYVFPINEVIIEAFATGPPGPQGLTGPTGAQGPQGVPGGFNWYVSVKDWGATGDGSTDDTEAIQDAINAAVAQNLKAVFFPVGTYIVSPDVNGYILRLQTTNFTLFGPAKDAATIKVKNDAGDYVAMLSDGVSSGFYDLSGLNIHDLTWDQNSDGNAIDDASITGPLFNGFPRLAVRAYKGFYGNIYNCRFRNIDNINTIAINGGSAVTGWWSVHHNHFDYVGFGAYHDHSTVYFHGEGIRVHNNYFVGGGNAAITAIETHGASQQIYQNHVKQYFTLANITGVSATTSSNTACSQNVGEGMGIGIALWAFDYGGISGYALDSCIVSENEIEVDYDRWSDVVAFRNGITLYPTSTALCRNVKIKDNIIRYAAHSDTPVSNDNHSSGIAWHRIVSPTEGTEEVDIEITGNTISGALGPGIQYMPAIISKRIKVKDNNIIDPGNGCPTPATYAVGVMLNNGALSTQNIDCSNNKIVDTRTPHVVVKGLDATGTSVVDNARATENFVWCADGARIQVQHTHASAVWNLGAVAGAFHQRYATARYYCPPAQARTTLAMTQDVLYLCKFIVGHSHTFDRIGANVTVTPGTTNLRFGVWADNGLDAPGALLYDSGTVSAATTGFKEATVSYPLYANVYWLGVVAQSGTATITAMNVGVHSVGHGTATNLITSDYSGLICNGPFAGALTASPAVSNYAAFGPLILLRA